LDIPSYPSNGMIKKKLASDNGMFAIAGTCLSLYDHIIMGKYSY